MNFPFLYQSPNMSDHWMADIQGPNLFIEGEMGKFRTKIHMVVSYPQHAFLFWIHKTNITIQDVIDEMETTPSASPPWDCIPHWQTTKKKDVEVFHVPKFSIPFDMVPRHAKLYFYCKLNNGDYVPTGNRILPKFKNSIVYLRCLII